LCSEEGTRIVSIGDGDRSRGDTGGGKDSGFVIGVAVSGYEMLQARFNLYHV